MHEEKTKKMRRMSGMMIRKDSTPRTSSAPRRRGRIYSEHWDLSHLAKSPVEHFEALVGDIESKVARFESARGQLGPTMPTSTFHPLLTLSEDIAAASSRMSAYAYL